MQIQTIPFHDPEAPKRFADSLYKTGFAIVDPHPISTELLASLKVSWTAFFSEPIEEKKKFLLNPPKHDGYVSSATSETAKGYHTKDLKEFFQFYDWGRCPEKQRAISEAYFAEASSLGATLLEWIEAALPADVRANLSEPLSAMIKDSDTTQLRLIHYPPLSGTEAQSAFRSAAHEDINLLTLLPSATTKGLQIQTKEGWQDVPYKPNQIIVNIGDMLQECTGGYFKATTHRVINPEKSDNKSRMAAPLFLHPRNEVKLSDRHTAGSFVTERYTEIGLY